MENYDFYLNPQKPSIGLYMPAGAGLPDIADAKDWIFDAVFDGYAAAGIGGIRPEVSNPAMPMPVNVRRYSDAALALSPE